MYYKRSGYLPCEDCVNSKHCKNEYTYIVCRSFELPVKSKNGFGSCAYLYSTPNTRQHLIESGEELVKIYRNKANNLKTDGFCCFSVRSFGVCQGGYVTDIDVYPIDKLSNYHWVFTRSRKDDLALYERARRINDGDSFEYGACIYLLSKKTDSSQVYDELLDNSNDYVEIANF